MSCSSDEPADDHGGTSGTSSTSNESESVDETGSSAQVGTCTRYEPGEGTGVSWLFHCGTVGSDGMNSLSVDAQGNVLVMFALRGTGETEFASLQIGDQTIDNEGLSDFVLAKLDPDGEVLWVQPITGPDDQFPSRMTACGDGLVYAWNNVVESTGARQGTLERLDADGNSVWSLTFPEPDGELQVNEMDCDPGGNVVLTGVFHDPSGGFPGGQTDSELFMLDAAGSILWSRSMGTFGSNTALAPNGDVIIAGSFDGQVDLGGGPRSAMSGTDVFLARYSSMGDHLWDVQIGPEGLQYANGLAVADDGRIGLSGKFLTSIELGEETFENVFPEQEPDLDGTRYDVFVAELDATGQVVWGAQQGTMLDDDSRGELYGADGVLQVMTQSIGGEMELRTYADGMSASLLSFPGFGVLHAELARGEGPVVYMGATISGEIDNSIAGVSIPGQGLDDLLVARLEP